MKRSLFAVAALLASMAVALPAHAEFQVEWGGLFHVRIQANENMGDGSTFNPDDEDFFIDQRTRIYLNFVASENLRVVTQFEMDTQWGHNTGGRNGGGNIGADETNVEMKNAYLDFNIPNTPINVTAGVQGFDMPLDWMFADDGSALLVTLPMDPFLFRIGYVAALNDDVQTKAHDIDMFVGQVSYASGPLAADLALLYQTQSRSGAGPNGYSSGMEFLEVDFYPTTGGLEDDVALEDPDLVDIGARVAYEDDNLSAHLGYVQNLGSFRIDTDADDIPDDDQNFGGFMIEGDVAYALDIWTFHLGGFFTSGGEDPVQNLDEYFVYPLGGAHAWSEIMGLGTFDIEIDDTNGDDRITPGNRGQYNAGEQPSNLWMVTAGVAVRPWESTRFTLNYYYIGTSEDVYSGLDALGAPQLDSDIGHEINLIIDQEIADGLEMQIVAGYLFAGNALSQYNDDQDIWEAGVQLEWGF